MKKHKGFTMAEILISLTIIGIIAAITLPSLRANINEKAWATQRKALYSRMSQAIAMLPSLNGYGEYEGSWNNDVVTVTKDTAAQAFVTDGLAKVLNITNICSIPANSTSENARKAFKKCGIPDKIITMPNIVTGKPQKINFPTNLTELNPMFTSTFTTGGYNYYNPQRNINTNATAFETKNGESVAVFYNPLCQSDMGETSSHSVQRKMCANFIYDLNGKKGPNTVGKDIGFITVFYPSDSLVVMPIPLNKDSAISQTYANALKVCRNVDPDVRLPNREELAVISFNSQLLNISLTRGGVSSIYAATKGWKMVSYYGAWSTGDYDGGLSVRCIKR